MEILLAAIVIAGRSGSAFAAQIGTMQVNQEIDAMKTLGLDPVEMLVLPRVMALVISMPLIAVFADIMGLDLHRKSGELPFHLNCHTFILHRADAAQI